MLKKDNLKNKSETRKNLESYLTHIKELPPTPETHYGEEHKKPRSSITGTEYIKEKEGVSSTGLREDGSKEEFVDGDFTLVEEEEKRLPVSLKDVILGILNVISIAVLIFVLIKLPLKAKELKDLRIERIKGQESISYKSFEIEEYKSKAEELEEFFLNEEKVIEFVNMASRLGKVSFASQKPVKDITGNFGLPVVIELEGTRDDLDTKLQSIDNLPFLFRGVRVEISPLKEEGMITLKYGLFLYVDENLGKNR